MVHVSSSSTWRAKWLSVLALSSRFDGPPSRLGRTLSSHELSVLALSSRFDGPSRTEMLSRVRTAFQYSLCRVVLMVHKKEKRNEQTSSIFQYSLCRVVLMVLVVG